MLGCELYSSTVEDVGCYFNIDSAWLDGVYIHDIAVGIRNEASNTVYFTNLRNQATLATDLSGNYFPYGLPQFIATGGTITTDGDFTIHKFNSTDTLNITSCPNNMELTMLVIAGGGGGGELGGGGGGAGGLIYEKYYPISAGAKAIVIGTGGLGATVGSPYERGQNGQNTTFNGFTAIGGGGGGGNAPENIGGVGGSGGGSGGFAVVAGGAGTVGQGNSGGSAGVGDGGGGGGAGGAGVAGNTGTRGAGLSYSISGASVEYARGGAGSGATGNSTNGAANTGEGGGGNYLGTAPGNGGSGVVIIRYKTPS